ncbi:MAG: protein kinase [Thermomonas sp.]|nr:protein kinase [Thermomonas sp.]
MSSIEQPQIDGYRILRVVGHGGMSTVYLAEQASLGRKVALKVMLPEALADEVSRARFENEARTIARLQHPHIVGIHEVGRTADGLPFYSMPYLPRGHLAQRNLRGDQQKVAAILRAMLAALDFAHVRGVVHRDVKAENVLFDENERPMLADFGIALRRGNNPRLTSTGLAVGSTAYMPPEQARGREVDRRADIYSIGVLAWEMLTGRLPFNAGDALSMALKHVQDPIPRLPPVLRHWQGFIDKSLAKQPADRYASAQEMLDALDELERRAGRNFGPVEVPAPTDDDAPVQPARRAGWKPWALALAAVAALAFGAHALRGSRTDTLPASEDVARAQAPAARGEALPAPAADPQTGLSEAAPGADASGIGAYLANAEQQLREGHLLAPANGNAWDSLDAAWRVDATHPQTQMLTARVFDALADLGERSLGDGDLDAARTAFARARTGCASRRRRQCDRAAAQAAGRRPWQAAGHAGRATGSRRRRSPARRHPLAGAGGTTQRGPAGTGRGHGEGEGDRDHQRPRQRRPGGESRRRRAHGEPWRLRTVRRRDLARIRGMRPQRPVWRQARLEDRGQRGLTGGLRVRRGRAGVCRVVEQPRQAPLSPAQRRRTARAGNLAGLRLADPVRGRRLRQAHGQWQGTRPRGRPWLRRCRYPPGARGLTPRPSPLQWRACRLPPPRSARACNACSSPGC